MTIGALARAARVPVSTVRFYERRKLVVPQNRSGGNYRLYVPGDVLRVRFIRRAQELGFTLEDVSQMLRLSAGETVRRGDVNRIGRQKLEDLDERIEDLKRMRRALAGLLAQPCIDPDVPCPVIAALGEE